MKGRSVPAHTTRRLDARAFLVLVLVAADMLTGEPELRGDHALLESLVAGFADGPAESEPRLGYLLPRGHVRIAGCDDIAHRVGHLTILASGTRVWPLAMMPYLLEQRN